MSKIKNIEIVFHDDSYVTLRPGGQGDTYFGEHAHKIMHEMNRHFNYGNPSFEEKLAYIRSLHQAPPILKP